MLQARAGGQRVVGDVEARIEWLEQNCFGELEIPEALSSSVERHRENLVKLIRTLQSAGITESQIEASVSVIVASYRDELIHAIKSMARGL